MKTEKIEIILQEFLCSYPPTLVIINPPIKLPNEGPITEAKL